MSKLNIPGIAISYLTLFLLLFLTANALVANWTLNPVWDLLYARVQSSFFHNVHATSMLSVCVACFYLLARARLKGMPIIIIGCIATASIHELTLAAVDMGLSRVLPRTVSLSFALYLSIFLVAALWKGFDWQRRILGAQFFILAAIYLLDIFFKPGSTIIGSQPTQLFYNPLTNGVEVASWLIPASLWLLPQKWVEKWSILSQR